MFLKEHADIRAKIEAKVLPMLGLKAPVPAASANGTAPEPAKALGVPGITPAKPVAVVAATATAAERRK
jgi:hypothetical protein